MKGYPQYLWFVVLALLLVCTGCSNEGETEDDNNQHVKVEGFYVKGLENVNACVEFDVEVDAAGTYTLHVMGYNYSKGTATCSLYVNGQKQSQLGFQEQSNWSEKVVQVSLAAGINQIAFQRDAGDNGQFSATNEMVPPSFVNLTALLIMLSNTSLILSSSAIT